MKILNRCFYERETVLVAKELLDKLLVRRNNNQIIIGKIVEV
ncbi:MAG: hypothetical protein QXE37_01460 [Nitrososphaerales archaeon]